MDKKTDNRHPESNTGPVGQKEPHRGGIVSVPEDDAYLDSIQLHRLEQSFRRWAEDSPRRDIRTARRRILIVFLLIRHTGAKLSEVLALNPFKDIDPERLTVMFRHASSTKDADRIVPISKALSEDILKIVSGSVKRGSTKKPLGIDPGFVRRKFYERARACGFPKQLGGPEMIRKARAVELMQGNLPLPAVQKMLGHSTPNQTSSCVSFSEKDIEQITKLHIERESSRTTSARNTFWGKIETILKGDIQARVVLATLSDYRITTIITTDSLERLGLQKGRFISAEIKAPWMILESGLEDPQNSAENRFLGMVDHISQGCINTEYTVRISDGTRLCAIVSTQSARRLNLETGDTVWVCFNCFSVILNAY